MEDGVLVANIRSTEDDNILKSFFSQFGEITDWNVQPDKFNDSTKICYLRFTTVESASKCVKKADRSNQFGDPLRVSFKKFTPRSSAKTNGVVRSQSFGRGFGSTHQPPIAPSFNNETIRLRDVDLLMERKYAVEIVELKSLSDILARPLSLTEKGRPELYRELEKINENVGRLINVKNPVVDEFYLAKWTEDDKFYRAKILDKITDSKFKVCFVDEGTSGDIVTELRVLPENLLGIPCQFLPCVVECDDTPEMIDLIIKESAGAEVSIYCTSKTKTRGKCTVNIFINDRDVVEIYRAKYGTDPRLERLPNKRCIKSHTLDVELPGCRLTKSERGAAHLMVLIKETVPVSARLAPLTAVPIAGDLLFYKDKGGALRRGIVESVRFENERIVCEMQLVDEPGCVEVPWESLQACALCDLNFPTRLVRGVLDRDGADPVPLADSQTVMLTDYDAKKDLYVLQIVAARKRQPALNALDALVGQIKTVAVTHVESGSEFYTQFSQEPDMSTLVAMQEDINSEQYRQVRVHHAKDLRVDQVVVAPFQSVRYRAVVRQIDTLQNLALLFFMDYGNSEWVVTGDVLKAHQHVVDPWPLARRCCLSVPIERHASQAVKDLLLDYSEHGEAEVHMKISGIEDGVLLVNLTANNKSTFIDILQFKGLLQTASTVPDESATKAMLVKKIADLESRIARLEGRCVRK